LGSRPTRPRGTYATTVQLSTEWIQLLRFFL
jgi:hypothetical protein